MTISDDLLQVATTALDDLKAQNVTVLNIQALTSMADYMVVASGTSSTHVRALAHNVSEKAKAAGCSTVRIEGERDGDWLLVDLGDIIVHVMLPAMREFYDLEKLWQDPNQKPIPKES
ncbi:MAG TPA: ribosome silencing factor [Alcanivoracaceae bacterium]|nr:ribosome silencing factor [Alcanivoracaceae bacterium]